MKHVTGTLKEQENIELCYQGYLSASHPLNFMNVGV